MSESNTSLITSALPKQAQSYAVALDRARGRLEEAIGAAALDAVKVSIADPKVAPRVIEKQKRGIVAIAKRIKKGEEEMACIVAAQSVVFRALEAKERAEVQSQFDSFLNGDLSPEAFVAYAKKHAKQFIAKATE